MAIYCTIVTFCTIGGFMFYSNLATPFNAEAAITKYYSISNGEWSTNIWSGVSNTGATCTCAPTCNLSIAAQIQHHLTVTSCPTFDISGGVTVDLNNGGDLIVSVSGKFTISGGSRLNMAAGDTVIVNGDLELSGGSTIQNDGYLVIYGNLKLTGGSSICGTGQGYYTGTKNGNGWCFTGTLPIELVSFNAKKMEGGSVSLMWVTASEVNNDYFTIERSINGIDFIPVLQLPGAGNSTKTLHYSTKDDNPLEGKNYYRLKQTDYDGAFTYSDIEEVKIVHECSIQIYPNVIDHNGVFHVKTSSGKGQLQLIIFSIKGMIVLEQSITTGNGITDIYTDDRLAAGTYIIHIYDNENSMLNSTKIIVQQ
jgi:hypothetical protein